LLPPDFFEFALSLLPLGLKLGKGFAAEVNVELVLPGPKVVLQTCGFHPELFQAGEIISTELRRHVMDPA